MSYHGFAVSIVQRLRFLWYPLAGILADGGRDLKLCFNRINATNKNSVSTYNNCCFMTTFSLKLSQRMNRGHEARTFSSCGHSNCCKDE